MKGTLTALTFILCTPFLAAAQDAGMNGCAGNITGIGAVNRAVLRFFDPKTSKNRRSHLRFFVATYT